jgi:hypothetical protein
MLRDFLIHLGFRCMQADHAVFTFKRGPSEIIIPVYVDDKLLAGNDENLLSSIQKVIASRFKVSSYREASWILGFASDKTAGTFLLTQPDQTSARL